MEGNIKQDIFNIEEDLQKKMQIIGEKKKLFFDKKKIKEREVEALLRKEEELKKQRRKFLQKKEALEEKIIILKKREAVVRSEKKEIEEKEKVERDLIKKREIEKKRWEIEEKKREIEKEKWGKEDKAKLLSEEIREIEIEVTRVLKPQRKIAGEKIIKIVDLLRRIETREKNLKKEGIEAKRAVEENRKKEIEEKKRAEEEKKKQELEFKKEESEKDTKDEEARKKIEEVFKVIEKNKEEISSLKEELLKKEKEQIGVPDTLSRQFSDGEKSVDFSEEKRKEDYKELVEKEIKMQQQVETEKKQIDFIREKVKEEQERWQKMQERVRSESSEAQDIYTTSKKEHKNEEKSQEKNTFLQTPFQQQKRDDDQKEEKDKEEKLKMEEEEAEALFKKAEQSFYAGNFSTARSRFDRIAKNYIPSENNSLFGAIKTKSLNEKAIDYLQKINDKENKKQGIVALNNSNLLEDEKLNEERKKIEQELQELLAERRRIKESKKKMEEEGVNEEIIREIDNEFNDLEKKRTEAERKLGKIIVETEERKENFYSGPTVIVKEIVRERGDEKVKDEIKEEIQKEIEKIIKEKERLSKIEKLINKKKEDESIAQSEEIRAKEKEIEKEKEKLEEKERATQSEEIKEEIRKRKKEMEEELRKFIEKETTEKWEKRIRGVESEITEVNKKYKELTEKERHLRGKIKEMESWGPEGRKRKEEVYEYRSLYKKSAHQTANSEEKLENIETKEKEKTFNFPQRVNFFFKSLLKPNKDFFLSSPLLVAIDISDYSIEVFCINNKGVTISFGGGLLEEGVVYNGEIRDEERLKKALLQILLEAKPKSLKQEKGIRIKGIVSLPESKVFTQQLKITGEDSVLERVKEEIRNKIPIPIEDLYFYYQTISFVNKNEKMVLCVTVEKKTVDKYIEFLQSIDIDPIVFDLEGVALGRAVLSTVPEKNKNTKEILSEMIVDIGARVTTISVFCNRELSLSVGVPFGGAYFTENIAKTLNISKEEAEKKKIMLGVDGEIREILSELLEKITEEIRNAESYYERTIGGKIQKIFLTGGSVIIPKILEYFKESLGEIVEIGNPLQKIKPVKELKESEALIYANAIGLALRTVEKDPIDGGFNLLPEEIKKQEKRYQRERKRIVQFGAMLVALVGVTALSLSSYYAYKTFSFLSNVSSTTGEMIVVEENKKVNNYEEITNTGEGVVLNKEEENMIEENSGIVEKKEETLTEEKITRGSTIVVSSEGISAYEYPESEVVVATVYAGEEYVVLQKVIDWLLIEREKKRGWIKKEDVDFKK
jgi:type IV pilus assembly protein PilM